MAGSRSGVSRWAEAVVMWLCRPFTATIHEVVEFPSDELVRGVVTLRVGLRTLRFVFEEARLQMPGERGEDTSTVRLMFFYSIHPGGPVGVLNMSIVYGDRAFVFQGDDRSTAADAYDFHGRGVRGTAGSG